MIFLREGKSPTDFTCDPISSAMSCFELTIHTVSTPWFMMSIMIFPVQSSGGMIQEPSSAGEKVISMDILSD